VAEGFMSWVITIVILILVILYTLVKLSDLSGRR